MQNEESHPKGVSHSALTFAEEEFKISDLLHADKKTSGRKAEILKSIAIRRLTPYFRKQKTGFCGSSHKQEFSLIGKDNTLTHCRHTAYYATVNIFKKANETQIVSGSREY